MADFEVVGAEEFKVVGRRLVTAGEEFEQDLSRNIRAALQPLEGSIKDSLRGGAPRRGGLAETLGNKTSVKALVTHAGNAVEATVRVATGADTEGIDQGVVHHPTFGHEPNERQSIKARLISEPIEKSEHSVEAAVDVAMEQTALRVTR